MPPLLSRLIQERRYQVSRSFIDGDILELGCGTATITEALHPGQSYTGIEYGPRIMEWLKQNRPGYDFYRYDLDRDEINLDRQFDTILMVAVIEHLADPRHILRQMPRLLRPGGRLVITTPTPFGNLIHSIGVNLGLFYKTAAQDHKHIYDQVSLPHLLKECGLEVIKYRSFILGGNQLCVSQLSTAKR
jgi:SAM-dependent methyltransferase